MEIPYPRLLPANEQGFINIIQNEDKSTALDFYPSSQIPPNDHASFSHFLFIHHLPKYLIEKLSSINKVEYFFDEYNQCSIERIDSTFILKFSNSSNDSFSLIFLGEFYYITFLNELSLIYDIGEDSKIPNLFHIIPLFSPIRKSKTMFIKEKLSSCVHDLSAHQSLVEFLNFPSSYSGNTICHPLHGDSEAHHLLNPFDENILQALFQNPHDLEVLNKLFQSQIPFNYSPLLMIILLLDRPLSEDESNTFNCMTQPKSTTSHAKIIQSPPVRRLSAILPSPPERKVYKHLIYGLDELSIGGSTDTTSDYEALKLQWSTITSSQFQHLTNLRISLKLLENSSMAMFTNGHPLVKIIFNVMASLFVMKDQFETYVAEFFNILVGIAQLFHPITSVTNFDGKEIEHLIFWLFYALITKSGAVEFLEQRQPEVLLEKVFHIIMVLHPLLYEVIEKAGFSSLHWPASVLFSLFSKVILPPRLFSVWIAALSSGDPMDFFQHLMAMSLILIYPDIIEFQQTSIKESCDDKNLVDAIENSLKQLFNNEPVELLVSNTIKLMQVTQRNC